MHSFLILILILLSGIGLTYSEIYSSYLHLVDAIEDAIKSDDLVEIKRFIAQKSDRIKRYRAVLREHRQLKKLIKSDGFSATHPTSALKFTQRTAGLVEKLQELDNGSVPVFNKKRLANMEGRSLFPDMVDFHGMIASITRLQDIHRIKASDIAAGKVDEFTTTPLNAMECLDIARHLQTVYTSQRAHNIRSYKAHLATEWLDTAESLVTTREEAEYLIKVSNENYEVVNCECTSDNLDRREYFMLKFRNLNSTVNPKCASRGVDRCKSFSSTPKQDPDWRSFDALCRGETVKPSPYLDSQPTPKDRLQCRYVHNNDPVLLLNPVKAEYLNMNHPKMTLLHDVIYDSEIQILKDTAGPNLKRGTIRKMQGQIVSDSKVSQQFFIPLDECKNIIPRLRSRLAAATGMSLRSFERIQVVNYGAGGYYTLHLDLFTPSVLSSYSETTNNRLVTMVLYLGDVVAGGETAFPTVGIAVKPKKGNAFVFYNIKRNGQLIGDSLHSSCPILYGEKWIANQWVGRNGQEFNYPCAIDKTL